jgi:hypothetical protein
MSNSWRLLGNHRRFLKFISSFVVSFPKTSPMLDFASQLWVESIGPTIYTYKTVGVINAKQIENPQKTPY